MKLVCMSDTHWRYTQIDINCLPEGDVLVHSGDLTGHGTISELRAFNSWLGELPYKHKVIIAGNHDIELEAYSSDFARKLFTNAKYLYNNSIEIDGVLFWGSPYTPPYNNWAFMRDENQLEGMFSQIPEEVDVLVTHGPAYGRFDLARDQYSGGFLHVGSKALAREVDRAKPKVHVFGHVHEAYGRSYGWGPAMVNCSMVNGSYKLTRKPIVIDLDNINDIDEKVFG